MKLREFIRKEMRYPIETTKVKVGINGSHYHRLDCPAAQKDNFVRNPEHYDYLEVEVPRVVVDYGVSIPFLFTDYIRCPLCMLPSKPHAQGIKILKRKGIE